MLPLMLAAALAGPGMVADRMGPRERLEKGVAELNAKAPFEDDGATFLGASLAGKTVTFRYRLPEATDPAAARALFTSRFCTAQPIARMVKAAQAVVAVEMNRDARPPGRLRVDARTCRAARRAQGR